MKTFANILLFSILSLVPFASTFIRAVTGAIGFLGVMIIQKKLGTLAQAAKDKKGMNAAFWATFTGPFIGVSLSLMAVRYTEAGIASTLMALTPVFILWPAHLVFGQKVTLNEVMGAIIRLDAIPKVITNATVTNCFASVMASTPIAASACSAAGSS